MSMCDSLSVFVPLATSRVHRNCPFPWQVPAESFLSLSLCSFPSLLPGDRPGVPPGTSSPYPLQPACCFGPDSGPRVLLWGMCGWDRGGELGAWGWSRSFQHFRNPSGSSLQRVFVPVCLAPAGPLGPVLPWVIGEKFVARSLPRACIASRRGCGGAFFSNTLL